MRKFSWRRPLRSAGLAVASSGLAFGLLMAGEHGARITSAALAAVTGAPAVAATAAPPTALDPLSEAFANTAAAVKPSVVYITATRTPRATSQPRQQRMPQRPDMPGLPPRMRS